MKPHRVAALVIAGIVGAASVATAHDFWIIPDMFAVPTGARIGVQGQTSSLFPTSVSAVTPDRIVEARVLTADQSSIVRDASVSGSSLRLAYSATTPGQHVIGVQLAPRNVRETPASFRRYLDLEGAPEARQRYEREGKLPPVGGDSITRRYAKYAKTFVEVGQGSRAFSRVVGHPLEMVPLSDPGSVRVGDTLRFRVMLLGKPLFGAKLHAGSIPPGANLADTSVARRAAAADVSVTTDSAGVAAVVLTRPGTWNLRTIQIVPAVTGSGADWDVHWATATFSVGRR